MKRVCVNCTHCKIVYFDKKDKTKEILSVRCLKKDMIIVPYNYSGKHFKAILEDFKKGNTLPMQCFERK